MDEQYGGEKTLKLVAEYIPSKKQISGKKKKVLYKSPVKEKRGDLEWETCCCH